MNSLLTLLSLDWVNAELDLGLEFESLWKAELTSSNIIIFLCDCFALSGVTVDLAEVEGLVILAMRYVESHNGQQLAGKVRLHKIVNRVLEYGRTLDWVSVSGDSIAGVFASGPGELLDRIQQDRRNQPAEEVHDTQSEKVLTTPELRVCNTIAD